MSSCVHTWEDTFRWILYINESSFTFFLHLLLQTSYETVLRDSSVFVGIKWKTMIADEAHRFKSVSGQTRSVITRMDVMWKLLLTGTLTLPSLPAEKHSLQLAVTSCPFSANLHSVMRWLLLAVAYKSQPWVPGLSV